MISSEHNIVNPRSDDQVQVRGFGDYEDEDGICDGTDGNSTQISACHEAAETRTIRFKKTFSNDVSPQLHRG